MYTADSFHSYLLFHMDGIGARIGDTGRGQRDNWAGAEEGRINIVNVNSLIYFIMCKQWNQMSVNIRLKTSRFCRWVRRRRNLLWKNCSERVYEPYLFFFQAQVKHWLWSVTSHHISRLFQDFSWCVFLSDGVYKQVSCQVRRWYSYLCASVLQFFATDNNKVRKQPNHVPDTLVMAGHPNMKERVVRKTMKILASVEQCTCSANVAELRL